MAEVAEAAAASAAAAAASATDADSSETAAEAAQTAAEAAQTAADASATAADASATTSGTSATNAATSADEAAASADEAAASVAQLLEQTPSLEEIVVSVHIGQTISAALEVPVHVAPYTLEAASLALATVTTVAASDTNYWTVTVKRRTNGVVFTLATKTTKVTGGEAITSWRAWDFDVIPISTNVLLPGDTLTVTFTPTGSPTSIVNPTLTLVPSPAEGSGDPHVGDVLVASDTFNRADNVNLGNADLGGAWAENLGNWSIVSNEIKHINVHGTAVLDLGYPDIRVQAKITAFGTAGSSGLVVRADGSGGNYYALVINFATPGIYRYASTSGTLLLGTVAPAVGDTIALEVIGNQLYAYLDAGTTGVFTEIGRTTDNTYATQTKVGFRASGNNARFDDIKVFV